MTHILFSAARERRLTRVSVIATAALLGGTLAAPGLIAATTAPTAASRDAECRARSLARHDI